MELIGLKREFSKNRMEVEVLNPVNFLGIKISTKKETYSATSEYCKDDWFWKDSKNKEVSLTKRLILNKWIKINL